MSFIQVFSFFFLKSTSDFLKAWWGNVQTTWRLACQQLSVHSARNQAALADTNCRAPQRLEPQLAHWAGDVTHTAHRRICNKLQEVHSSKLISIRPCHVIDFYKAALRTSATKNNYSVYNGWPRKTSHHQWRAAAKRQRWLHLKVTSRCPDNCSQIVRCKAPVLLNLWVLSL